MFGDSFDFAVRHHRPDYPGLVKVRLSDFAPRHHHPKWHHLGQPGLAKVRGQPGLAKVRGQPGLVKSTLGGFLRPETSSPEDIQHPDPGLVKVRRGGTLLP